MRARLFSLGWSQVRQGGRHLMTQVMWPHLSWPAAVGSGLLYIVMHGDPDKSGLKRVMEPILRKLGPASFDCVDGKLAWSAKRPVWFQAIVDLLEPYFVPILGEHNWSVSMSLCLNFCQMSCSRTLPGGDAGWGTASGRYHSSGLRSVESEMQTCHVQVQIPRDKITIHCMCIHIPKKIQPFSYLSSRVRSPLWPRCRWLVSCSLNIIVKPESGGVWH